MTPNTTSRPFLAAALLALAAAGLTACATPEPAAPAADGSAPAPAATVHEYRTGSTIAAREHHVTTQQERDDAEAMANRVRSTPSLPGGGH